MKRSAVLLGLLATVAAGGVACSDTASGQPTTSNSTSSAAPPTASSRIPLSGGGLPTSSATSTPGGGHGSSALAKVDPCVLAGGAAAELLGADTAGPQTLGGARDCHYNGGGMTLDVAIFDTLGLDDIQGTGPTTKTTVGGHQAVQAKDSLGGCIVSIGVTDASRVDVIGRARGEQSKACQLATQAARSIEPALP